jgi:hypothetical protein
MPVTLSIDSRGTMRRRPMRTVRNLPDAIRSQALRLEMVRTCAASSYGKQRGDADSDGTVIGPGCSGARQLAMQWMHEPRVAGNCALRIPRWRYLARSESADAIAKGPAQCGSIILPPGVILESLCGFLRRLPTLDSKNEKRYLLVQLGKVF